MKRFLISVFLTLFVATNALAAKQNNITLEAVGKGSDHEDENPINSPKPEIGIEEFGADLAFAVSRIGSSPASLVIDSTVVLPEGQTVVVPSTVTLKFSTGGTIDGVAGGGAETLTINGAVDAGLQRIFGSNLTVNGVPQVAAFYPDWWGDNADAAQAAIDTAYGAGGGRVVLHGSPRWDRAVRFRPTVDVVGSGLRSTVIDSRAAKHSIYSDEAVINARYGEFTVSHANNVNEGVDAIDFVAGISQSRISARILAKNGVTKNGLRIRGSQGRTANNNQYGNVLDLITELAPGATEVEGIALFLDGADILNARCNANTIQSGKLDGFTTGLKINGNGNLIQDITLNGPCTGGAGISFEGDGTYGNMVINPYLDGGIVGDPIRLNNTATSGVLHMATIIGSVRELSPLQIKDLSHSGGSATYRLDNRHKIFLAQPAKKSDNPGNGYVSGVFGSSSNDVFHISADDDYAAGGIELAGPTSPGGVNAIATGGVSARINATSGEFRVVKTPNGSTFTALFSVLASGAIQELETSNGPVGTFTLSAAATTPVNNTSVTASSIIQVFPTNAPAASLMGGTSSLYISARTAGKCFAVSTADGNSAGGTETFNYIILN